MRVPDALQDALAGALDDLAPPELPELAVPPPPPPPPPPARRTASRPWYTARWPYVIAGLGAIGVAIWRMRDVAATLNIIAGAVHPSNYKPGRTAAVDTIVVHTTEGSATSAKNWFAMDHSVTGQGPSSSHYIIDGDGTITSVVPLGDTAYHAANSNVNARSVGIELAGKSENPSMFTSAMLTALVALIRQLKRDYPAIPFAQRVVPGILGHVDVDQQRADASQNHTDPGPYFPWDWLFGQLTGRAVA